MTTTGVIVQSGHNLASPEQLIAALDDHKQTLEDAVPERASKVIDLSEMAAGKFREPLLDWAGENDWNAYHPAARGPSECAILSARPFKHQTYFLLTELELDSRVTRRSAPIFLTAAMPEDDSWHGMWHSPAHNGGLAPGNAATRAYRDALGRLKSARMRMGGKVAIAGDWNVDLRRDKIRATLTQRFPRMDFAGAARSDPTEGGRVIDGLLTNRRVLAPAQTLSRQPGFDHRGVLVVLG